MSQQSECTRNDTISQLKTANHPALLLCLHLTKFERFTDTAISMSHSVVTTFSCHSLPLPRLRHPPHQPAAPRQPYGKTNASMMLEVFIATTTEAPMQLKTITALKTHGFAVSLLTLRKQIMLSHRKTGEGGGEGCKVPTI